MNLPPRTRQIYARLVELTEPDGGLLLSTTTELAMIIGISRQTLHTHLTRMRHAGVLLELEAVQADDGWKRLRRVIPPLQTPLTTTQTYRQGKHALVGELRSPTNAGRCAPTEVNMSDEADDLADLLGSAPRARPFDPRLLPPYPSTEKIKPVVVPRMPRLRVEDAGASALLIRAYKAACSHRYGRRPRVDKQARFRMGRAALAMFKAKIVSPYAWAGFRLTQWQYSERRSKPPGIDYVFSAKVIEEHLPQYRRKAESYDVLHRVMLTPAHAELLELWERCRRAVASPNSGGIGQRETVRIVEGILPPAVYHDLMERVPAQREEMRADLYRRLAAGEWIW